MSTKPAPYELPGFDITLDTIFSTPEPALRKTKIICTMGPSCWSEAGLADLIERGMSIARLNFSHGDHEAHGATLARVRAAAEESGATVAALLDTKGPEIRTGFLASGGKVSLTKGQDLVITTDYAFKGDSKTIACSYGGLPASVSVGGKILAADGSVSFTVLSTADKSVTVRVENDFELGERKNMNLPGVAVDLPVLTEKDKDDLVNFGAKHGVDFVAASFVQRGSNIDEIREVLGDAGSAVKIIAKIENEEGLRNFDDILAKADGIMVARGDLGMEIPLSKVFLAQKMMVRKANIAGKPVIVATQMLESMAAAARPTRAEACDVANAVLDGADAVMLSGETAGGKFPNEAVEHMAACCVEAEAIVPCDALAAALRGATLATFGMSGAESVACSAVRTAADVGAKMIISLAATGRTTQLIAKYRPVAPVLMVTDESSVARQAGTLLRGVWASVLDAIDDVEAMFHHAVTIGKANGWIKDGDPVVYVYGPPVMRVLVV